MYTDRELCFLRSLRHLRLKVDWLLALPPSHSSEESSSLHGNRHCTMKHQVDTTRMFSLSLVSWPILALLMTPGVFPERKKVRHNVLDVKTSIKLPKKAPKVPSFWSLNVPSGSHQVCQSALTGHSHGIPVPRLSRYSHDSRRASQRCAVTATPGVSSLSLDNDEYWSEVSSAPSCLPAD